MILRYIFMFEKVSSTNYFKFYDSNLLTSMYHPLPLPMRAQMLVKPGKYSSPTRFPWLNQEIFSYVASTSQTTLTH